MTGYPVESGEVIDFTPEALEDTSPKISFKLRWANRKDKRRIRMIMADEGLQHYSTAEIRAETLRGVDALMGEEEAKQTKHRLEAFWDAIDLHQSKNAEKDDPEPFEHEDQKAVTELLIRLEEHWRELRIIAQYNAEFLEEMPRIYFRVLCDGWDGLNTKYAKTDLIVDDDVTEKLTAELNKINHGAWPQLITKALRMRDISEAQEKNSSSPPQSVSAPKTSEKTSAATASKNGPSQGSMSLSDAETPKTS